MKDSASPEYGERAASTAAADVLLTESRKLLHK